MAPCIITEAAVITALGNSPEELWQGLMAGETAIRPLDRFPVNSYPAKIAACIDNLKPSDGRSRLHALLNLLLSEIGPVPPDALLITATTKAGIDNLELLRRGKPADFQDILPYSIADTVSRKLGLAGNSSCLCLSTGSVLTYC